MLMACCKAPVSRWWLLGAQGRRGIAASRFPAKPKQTTTSPLHLISTPSAHKHSKAPQTSFLPFTVYANLTQAQFELTLLTSSITFKTPKPTMTFTSPAPYHLLAWGTLLGSTIFQSFIGGIISFRALPRPQFSTLQASIFPVYFALQTALPIALLLTYPSISTRNSWAPEEILLDTHALVAIGVMLVTAALNAAVLGPATTRCMKERKHQETRDGKKSYDAGPHSPEMQRLNSTFSQLHGASSLVNLGTLIAALWYGFELAARLV